LPIIIIAIFSFYLLFKSSCYFFKFSFISTAHF
jgi:hypothetical protein